MANKWYFAEKGKGYGPFTPQQISLLLEHGLVLPQDLVWQKGHDKSIRADEIPSMRETVERATNKPRQLQLGRVRRVGSALLAVAAIVFAGLFVARFRARSDEAKPAQIEIAGQDQLVGDKFAKMPPSGVQPVAQEQKQLFTLNPQPVATDTKAKLPATNKTPAPDPTPDPTPDIKEKIAPKGTKKESPTVPKSKSINLLKLVVLKRDGIRGSWNFTDDGALRAKSSDGKAGAALLLPYRPKGSYVLSITASRSAKGGIVLPIIGSGKQFGAYLSGGWQGSSIPVGPMRQDIDFFPTNEKVEITCIVRPKGVTITNNDSAQMEWSDWSTINGTGRPGDIPEGMLWIKVWETYTFYEIIFTPTDD